jgi:hypothetical protein
MGGSEFGLSGLDVAAVVFYFALILGIGMWVSHEHSYSHMYCTYRILRWKSQRIKIHWQGYKSSIDF